METRSQLSACRSAHLTSLTQAPLLMWGCLKGPALTVTIFENRVEVITRCRVETGAQTSLTAQGGDISRRMRKPLLLFRALMSISKLSLNRPGCSLSLWQEPTRRERWVSLLWSLSAGFWPLSRRNIQRPPFLQALPLFMCLSCQTAHIPKPWWKQCRSWSEHCHRRSPSQ